MTGLVLKLRPKERVLINGAVIENGDRRSKFSILTSEAKILRMRDALHPDEVNTPVRRVCYAAQLILTGDRNAEDSQLKLLHRIEELSQILKDGDSRAQLSNATSALIDGNHYRCLKSLRSLLSREQRLLAARN